jgi:hypothetical protein
VVDEDVEPVLGADVHVTVDPRRTLLFDVDGLLIGG